MSELQQSESLDLNAFIEGVMRDKTKERTSVGLRRLLMNVKDNQGTVTFIPIVSKSIKNIYTKIERVREYNGKTSLLDSGEGWYRILPVERYIGMTPLQLELYNEVVGLYDELFGWELPYDEARIRTYSIFTGILVRLVDTENNEKTDYKDNPCLFIYPSNSPIDALNTAISNKKSVLKDRIQQWLGKIISPDNSTGHQGVIQISFKKNDGPGYVSTVTFEVNDEFTKIVDPKKVYSNEFLSHFDDPIKTFLGWCYDYESKTYFNELLFRELRDNLTIRLKELQLAAEEDNGEPESYENKNGNVDPMTNNSSSTPIPGEDVRKEHETEVGKKTTGVPF